MNRGRIASRFLCGVNKGRITSHTFCGGRRRLPGVGLGILLLSIRSEKAQERMFVPTGSVFGTQCCCRALVFAPGTDGRVYDHFSFPVIGLSMTLGGGFLLLTLFRSPPGCSVARTPLRCRGMLLPVPSILPNCSVPPHTSPMPRGCRDIRFTPNDLPAKGRGIVSG